MRALVFSAPGQAEVIYNERPVAGPGEVVVSSRVVGVCHSDLELLAGRYIIPVSYPVIPGHEWAGEVAEVGPGVDGLKPGDPVVGEFGPARCSPRSRRARAVTDSGAGLDVYQAYRTAAPRRETEPRVATNRVLFAAESRDKAWEICGDHLLYQFNAYRQWFSAAGDSDAHGSELLDPAVLPPEQYFVGTPDDILAAVAESQRRLGYEELVFWARPPGMPIEHSTASLELIARHVLPVLAEVAT
ncbi:MAG TPA: alcohol dehydrogenase catalytic domain-containing protein [Streptosporangiaceae bacterium]